MARLTRNRHSTRTALALAASLGLLLSSTAATARHGDHDDRGRRYQVYEHGDSCDSRRSHRHTRQRDRYERGHDRHARHARYEQRRDSYYCDPCGKRFHSRRKFHRHVSHTHHVPLFALPFVIVKSTLGWIFHG